MNGLIWDSVKYNNPFYWFTLFKTSGYVQADLFWIIPNAFIYELYDFLQTRLNLPSQALFARRHQNPPACPILKLTCSAFHKNSVNSWIHLMQTIRNFPSAEGRSFVNCNLQYTYSDSAHIQKNKSLRYIMYVNLQCLDRCSPFIWVSI